MKPRVKCREAGVKGGDGNVSVRGSSLSTYELVFGQETRASWKYGEREMRMNRWEENIAVVSSWFDDENLPEREMRTSE